MAWGAFCLVLHGHLPWVLHHGRWPHGEDWLYEAAARTWMPLLGALERLRDDHIAPRWTIGLTPILLEQLSSPRFQDGFERWLRERAERARFDAREFAARGDEHLAALARDHEVGFGWTLDHFQRIGRSIPRAMAEMPGVELLSSNATHGFHPLLLHDASARAQLRGGFATSERHLGRRPRGMWLPECAYRPAGPWTPPAVHTDVRDRAGVARLAEEAGCEFFFVETHLVERSAPVARLRDGRVEPLLEPPAAQEGWGLVTSPWRVAEGDALTGISVLARCPDVSEQVWSGVIGYPGDGRYREFHKTHGLRGLHYWRVTRSDAALDQKEPYEPAAAVEAVEAHAHHFVSLVRARLAKHHAATGRAGVVCAPFDAELFGHWWYEGPLFLERVARLLAADPEIVPMTVGGLLDAAPADKVIAMPEGTWGEGGDHRVWLNDEQRFYWEIAYRAEDRFLDLWHRVRWTERGPGTELLEEAGRQLLLLQASDWPFVIHTRGAVDYGLRRILDHASRFDDLCNGVEDALSGAGPDPVVVEALQRCRLLDPVFPDLDLAWWAG
jgi:1,4-alpha-glucan branching enzyme